MAPADERLDPCDLEGGKVHSWLIEEEELPGLRPPEMPEKVSIY
jgi:hypothetical protein